MRKQLVATRLALLSVAIVVTLPIASGQGIFGNNLIVNGNAEAGPTANSPTSPVASIPGWTISSGSVTVLPYGLTNLIQQTDPAPPDHSFNYFANGGGKIATSTITQNIDVSSGASAISGGNVKYTASAYLGSAIGQGVAPQAKMQVDFKNGSGQVFSSAIVGPLGYNGNGFFPQQQIGLVPAGTVNITITLSLSFDCPNVASCRYAGADSLSLVLSMLGTTPGSVLGTNLVVNGNAESGAAAAPNTLAHYIPGWSTNASSVAPYGGTGSISTTDPGPPDRGVNVFAGGSMYQDIDISPAASLIDSSQVTYEISAWLGNIAGAQFPPTFTYIFYDWSGTQLAPTSQLTTPAHSGTGLFEASSSGAIPKGTRRVHITVSLPAYTDLADDIAFTLAAPGGPPVIDPKGGVISASAFGGYSDIAPGSWIEIYGTFLTSSPLRNNCAGGIQGSCWAGTDFNNNVAPTSLDGVSVSIGGQAAFIDYVSPGQIDAQVPSNAPTGVQSVVVTNANGVSIGFPIIVDSAEPGWLAPASFTVGGKQYVAAVLSDGQTFALPTNAISGVPSRPAHVGEAITIYGIGFGPVTGGIGAGAIAPGLNSLTMPLQVLFGTTPATLSYYGLAPSYVGLYQFNITVPNIAANNAVPISFTLGGVKGSQTLYIAVQN